ncbi:aminotransferase class I/II-fold pyridoxal phosphate-dependent enzyme [Brevibacterium sandarakinum]|uniref:aminotransferase class I/II-fold pyridoxal phosphate-dependent enzyme n=1 Tax=Brevibacterium sandarakinum TaxID=629680 RepID=UPI00265692A3|nr:aminotransferase class I/II-fold pyridoxal phosphate-dependent enzyme [Brevibacterium sandarakinum]MDN5634253.1 aminotransferase class I/II-fold pyridoxal phosphate-dependent enzyme [Brevibacterium sp.]MDN5658104.1 aminotransferase class I/II-fold pyridoxal phosphate-dependent enzyme [Brevibacterium sandarakinum]
MNAIASRMTVAAERRRAADMDRNDPVLNGLDLASNDYLGLSQHPVVRAAAIEAIEDYGTSARASRLVTGTTRAHHLLEAALTERLRHPACVTFSSGYLANIAAVTTLAGPDTLIVSDAHNHASLIDACRLTKASITVVAHNDPSAVETALADRAQAEALVIVESVYSVLGDAADLPRLLQLCERYDAILLADEAHGIGVAGIDEHCGMGAAAGLSEHRERLVVTATLSKALGSQGGALLGSELIRDAAVNTARSFIFDTGLAPANAAAAHAALGLITSDRVASMAGARNALATALEVPIPAGAVLSVPMPTPESGVRARALLRQEGILVGCFRPPSVPDGITRVRPTARAGLSPDELAHACERIRAITDACVAEAG